MKHPAPLHWIRYEYDLLLKRELMSNRDQWSLEKTKYLGLLQIRYGYHILWNLATNSL